MFFLCPCVSRYSSFLLLQSKKCEHACKSISLIPFSVLWRSGDSSNGYTSLSPHESRDRLLPLGDPECRMSSDRKWMDLDRNKCKAYMDWFHFNNGPKHIWLFTKLITCNFNCSVPAKWYHYRVTVELWVIGLQAPFYDLFVINSSCLLLKTSSCCPWYHPYTRSKCEKSTCTEPLDCLISCKQRHNWGGAAFSGTI